MFDETERRYRTMSLFPEDREVPAEASGVWVLLLGNPGSYHTNFPADVFRGCALADKIAPLVVINDQDARTAWPFTAVHELAHLWLGQTGMIGKTMWAALDERFREEWQAHKQREAERTKSVEGGPNHYAVRRHRIGDALLGLVRRSLDEGTFTYTKASRVLGVKSRNVEPQLSMRGAR